MEDRCAAFRASGLFGEPRVRRRRFDVEPTADEYVVNLSTQTVVGELPPAAGRQLVARVRRRVERGGGVLVVHHLAVATVARRSP